MGCVPINKKIIQIKINKNSVDMSETVTNINKTSNISNTFLSTLKDRSTNVDTLIKGNQTISELLFLKEKDTTVINNLSKIKLNLIKEESSENNSSKAKESNRLIGYKEEKKNDIKINSSNSENSISENRFSVKTHSSKKLFKLNMKEDCFTFCEKINAKSNSSVGAPNNLITMEKTEKDKTSENTKIIISRTIDNDLILNNNFSPESIKFNQMFTYIDGNKMTGYYSLTDTTVAPTNVTVNPSTDNSPCNSHSNYGESSIHSSITPFYNSVGSPKKISNFLKIKFDIFKNIINTNISKKLFLINLKKCLSHVAKFVELQKTLQKSYLNNVFDNGSQTMNYYRNNFDMQNNHSTELNLILEKNKKSYMLPLYQIISNNIDIKITKFVENVNPQIFTNQVLFGKYEILEIISNDMNNIWTIYKIKNIKKNKSYSMKIIEKKVYLKHGFKNFFNHEYIIKNRMALSKYSMKIKEIYSSNLYDYIIMESSEFSLFNMVTNDSFNLNERMYWKLFRNLIAAVDYSHNIARISHGNLNPYNVLFVDGGILKISDYSFSNYLDDYQQITCNDKTNLPCYPPPEHETSYNGVSSDIWQCGIILYFMVYKIIPCQRKTIPDKILLVLFLILSVFQII